LNSKKSSELKDSMKIVYESGWWFTPSFGIAADSMGGLNKIQIYTERYKKGDKRAITLLFFHIYQRENCKYLISVVQGWKQNQ